MTPVDLVSIFSCSLHGYDDKKIQLRMTLIGVNSDGKARLRMIFFALICLASLRE